MVKVSVIIPFVNEYPSIRFTVQSITDALRGFCPYEIILINNYCPEVTAQGFPEDKSAEYFRRVIGEGKLQNAKLLEYPDKLSHWNAKMVGAAEAQGKYLFFCDAHVMVPRLTLQGMIDFAESMDVLQPSTLGSLHLPIAYLNDSEESQLIYRMRSNPEKGMLHYTFHKYRATNPVDVPCMSSCGMLIQKRILLGRLGGWPRELGIYGGGENFISFGLSRLGLRKIVYNGQPLYHLDDNRGYYFNHNDWVRNRMIAIFLTGGEKWLMNASEGISQSRKLSFRKARALAEEVMDDDDLIAHHDLIESNAKTSLEDFIESWNGDEFSEHVDQWM